MRKLLSLGTAGIIGAAILLSTAQAGQLTTTEKEFLFNNPSVAKVETLSLEEMKNTEGTFWWLAPVISGAFYAYTHRNNFSWYGFGWSVAGGFIGPVRYGYLANRMLYNAPRLIKWYVQGHGSLINFGWQRANPWK
jgi:hypothetical protein